MSGTKQTCEWKVQIEVFIVKNVVHYVNQAIFNKLCFFCVKSAIIMYYLFNFELFPRAFVWKFNNDMFLLIFTFCCYFVILQTRCLSSFQMNQKLE